MEDHKKKLFDKYVSTLNVHLYSEVTADSARRHFSAFEKMYGKVLSPRNDARILDIGSGDGSLLFWLQSKGYANASGVDVSPEQVTQAKSLGIRSVECDDASHFLSASEGGFDLVFIRDTLGHLTKAEIPELLTLVHRKMQDGGTVVIKTPNAESPLSGQLRYGDFTHDVSFTRTSLMQVMGLAGFRELEVHGTPPVIHGAKSLVRFLLWKAIDLAIRVYRLADAGSGEGIYTQNIIAIGRKKI